MSEKKQYISVIGMVIVGGKNPPIKKDSPNGKTFIAFDISLINQVGEYLSVSIWQGNDQSMTDVEFSKIVGKLTKNTMIIANGTYNEKPKQNGEGVYKSVMVYPDNLVIVPLSTFAAIFN